MKKAFLTILFFTAGFLPELHAQESGRQADEYLERYYDLKRFSGSVLVANENEVLYQKSLGMSNYADATPLSQESLFNIAGLSEQFTAYIAFQLINQQKLSLLKPVKAYLRDIAWGDKANITLHHLLTHSSGLPDYPQISKLPEQQFASVDEMKAYLVNIKLQAAPGASFAYSKLNYNLLGLILERETGKTYDQLVKEWITEPLGMQSTFASGSAGKEAQVARGYVVRSYTTGWEPAPVMAPINYFAAQGIVSNTTDLLLWYRHVKERMINSPTYKLLFTPYLMNYGWGFKLRFNEKARVQELQNLAGVYNSGFNAWAGIEQASDQIIIVLSNNRHPVASEIGVGLRNIFQGKPYQLPLPREVVAVDPAQLREYAGEYTLREGFSLKVISEGDKLFVEDGIHPRFEVFPQSASQFFVENRDAAISFVRNQEGKVTEMVLYDGFLEGMSVKKKE